MTKDNSWQTIRFDHICKNISDRIDDPKTSNSNYYVGLEHLDSEEPKILRHGIPQDVSKTKLRFKIGHILFGKRNWYLRRVVVAGFDGICSAHMLVLEPRKEKIIQEFLQILMLGDSFYEKALTISAGSMSPTIRWKDIAKLNFLMPPIFEQKKIIRIISVIDESIVKIQNLLYKLKIYKKSKADDLLTKGIGHTKFKKVQWLFGKEIKIPEGWKPVKIEEVADKLLSGGTPSTSIAEYWAGGINWTRGAALTTHYLTKSERLISEAGLKNSSSSVIPKNNLLIASRVSIGNLSINKINVAINQDITAIILNSSLCSTEYLYWNLLNSIDVLALFSQGTTIQGFTRKDLSNHILLLPSLQEQQQIASTLTQLDEQYKQLQNHLSLLKKMRKSMINEKLTPPTLRKKIVR